MSLLRLWIASPACRTARRHVLRILGMLCCLVGFHGRHIRPWTTWDCVETCDRCRAVFINFDGRQKAGRFYWRRRSVFDQLDMPPEPPKAVYARQRLIKTRQMTAREAAAPLKKHAPLPPKVEKRQMRRARRIAAHHARLAARGENPII